MPSAVIAGQDEADQNDRTAHFTSTGPDEHDILDIGDGLVTQLRVDHAFSLLLDGGVLIRVRGAFSLVSPAGSTETLPAGEPHEVEAALGLLHDHVEDVSAEPSGVLGIFFASGYRMEVPPLEAFENWVITYSGAFSPPHTTSVDATRPSWPDGTPCPCAGSCRGTPAITAHVAG